MRSPQPIPKSASLSPELLTVSEVAELLAISPRLVWLLAEQGQLLPVHIRRCTRWRRADVLSYIDRLGPEVGHE
jgi:predicted DNA-binding transcriptional regulator AlpA